MTRPNFFRMSPDVSDPLAEIISLLQPKIAFTKVASGAGPWRLRKESDGHLFYCVVVEGGCHIQLDGQEEFTLEVNDFVLTTAAADFSMSSLDPGSEAMPLSVPNQLPTGEFWLGDRDQPVNVRTLVGHCTFTSPDAALLVSLMPAMVHVRGEKRLATLVSLLGDEAKANKPGQEVALGHLLELMLIEAFRSTANLAAMPSLIRGLADDRLAAAIRCMHRTPGHEWTMAELAKEAALSRSAFFDRFRREVGLTPMEYLFNWRMALAKNLLKKSNEGVAAVAARVGYRSASSFSVAFSKHVGIAPAQYARAGHIS